jgi:hypothetical protein
MTEFIFFVSGISSFNSQRFKPTSERGDFATGQKQTQCREFGNKIAMTTGRFGLTLKRSQLTAYFTQQVLDAQQ